MVKTKQKSGHVTAKDVGSNQCCAVISIIVELPTPILNYFKLGKIRIKISYFIKKPYRINGFHEKTSNELAILWLVMCFSDILRTMVMYQNQVFSLRGPWLS
jgi:hypothetical protein